MNKVAVAIVIAAVVIVAGAGIALAANNGSHDNSGDNSNVPSDDGKTDTSSVHTIRLKTESLDGPAFYYGDKLITQMKAIEIPDKGPITLKVVLPDGATVVSAGELTLDDDGSAVKGEYGVSYSTVTDGKTVTHNTIINIYIGDSSEKYIPVYKTVDGHVEMTVDYDGKNIQIWSVTGILD